jgi:hypothetical protein
VVAAAEARGEAKKAFAFLSPVEIEDENSNSMMKRIELELNVELKLFFAIKITKKLSSMSSSSLSAPAVRAKREIAWSPFSANEFVVGGTDLRFYSLTYKHESTLLRRNENAPLLASQVNFNNIKNRKKKNK